MLAQTLGADHHFTVGFVAIYWTPRKITYSSNQAPYIARFRTAAEHALGYLDAAMAALDQFGGEVAALDAARVDPELWEFVGGDLEAEHWAKAAGQTTLFLEDRIRSWTGQPQ